jgi:hypothetical protein
MRGLRGPTVKAKFVIALAALVASAAASTSAADTKARLTVVKSKPLAVRGTGFHPHEAVRITLLGSIKRTVKRAEAGANGSFKVAFRPAADGCSLVIAHAVGSEGSRASVQVGRPPCPPPR